jgi:hypothetical protein
VLRYLLDIEDQLGIGEEPGNVKTNQSLRAPCGCAGSVERTRLTGVQSAG